MLHARAFGQILADQTVHIFVRAARPRPTGIRQFNSNRCNIHANFPRPAAEA